MSILLFRLNDVPEDEAREVRELLGRHHIDYYETDAGRWGISVAALWLADEDELPRARELIDSYQTGRAARARADFEAERAAGRADTLLGRIVRRPLLATGYLLLILIILYFSIVPFARLV